MAPFTVTSDLGVRTWHADDADHAAEQHNDAFPDETILAISARRQPRDFRSSGASGGRLDRYIDRIIEEWRKQ